jgi:hypothetical protein
MQYVSNYLTRLVEKQYLECQRNEGIAKGKRKGLVKKTDTNLHQILVIDAQIENTRKKERHYKKKLKELVKTFDKL